MKDIISKERLNELTSKFSSLEPIVVAGDVGLDKYTFGIVRKISPEAPVPVLEVTKEWPTLGMAANISHNLKTLGIDSTLCGVIGNDRRANLFEELLEERDLKIWGIVREDERPTTFKERVTTNTQQICRVDYESVRSISKVTEDKVFERAIDFSATHNAIIIEDYSKGTLTESLTRKLIDKFKGDNKLVAVDPGRNTPPRFYKGATLLKPNLNEAQMMVQSLGYPHEENLENIARILVDKLELEMLVITLGKDGMALIDTSLSGEMKIIPTVATEVFDVSGAGDTAISLLSASLLAGATLEEAAWISNCGAGVVVSKKGTATINLKELKDFHQRLLERLA